MLQISTFGEILLRLATSEQSRFSQSTNFSSHIGGAEANVCAALAQWGHVANMISVLPTNALGYRASSYLKSLSASTDHITFEAGRMGLYFLEQGIANRGGNVIYDRAQSSFGNYAPENYDWAQLLSTSDWFHWSGITPALSQNTAKATFEALLEANQKNITTSVDLNYRSNLWKWGKSASEVCPALVSKSNILICNEEAAQKMLNIDSSFVQEEISSDQHTLLAEEIAAKFPSLEAVFIPIRRTINASHNYINLFGYYKGEFLLGKGMDISPIVDRVGAGDAMTAAIIHCIHEKMELPAIISNATAASALKHSINGDILLASFEEVSSLGLGEKTKIVR